MANSCIFVSCRTVRFRWIVDKSPAPISWALGDLRVGFLPEWQDQDVIEQPVMG